MVMLAIKGREVRFDLTRTEAKLVSQIVLRARRLVPINELSLSMDLSATHSNGCPIDFHRLLKFAIPDFLHDVVGISHHLDRESGELRNSFVPRSARVGEYDAV
jgi:hypothetical protein